MKILQKHDSVFIVDSEQGLLEYGNAIVNGAKYICLVDEAVFEKVKSFTSLFEDTIQGWLNRHDEPGTTYYWEEDYHDKICKFLSMMMPGVAQRDISNALSALGM